MWTVLVNMIIQNFKICNYHDESKGDLHLKYVLDLRCFVVNKLPGDGTVVPKHVGVGT